MDMVVLTVLGVMVFAAGIAIGYGIDRIWPSAPPEEPPKEAELSPERVEELTKLSLAYYDREGTAFRDKAISPLGCVVYLIAVQKICEVDADRIASLALDQHLNRNPIIPPIWKRPLGN